MVLDGRQDVALLGERRTHAQAGAAFRSRARLVEQDGPRGLRTFFQLQVDDDAAHRRGPVRAVERAPRARPATTRRSACGTVGSCARTKPSSHSRALVSLQMYLASL